MAAKTMRATLAALGGLLLLTTAALSASALTASVGADGAATNSGGATGGAPRSAAESVGASVDSDGAEPAVVNGPDSAFSPGQLALAYAALASDGFEGGSASLGAGADAEGSHASVGVAHDDGHTASYEVGSPLLP